MKKIVVLVSFFAKSLFKNRATLLFLFLATLLMVLVYFMSDINIAVRFKLFEDVLLSSQMFLLHLAALFYSFEMLTKDKIQGIFVLPLSTNMRRQTYIFSLSLAIAFMIFWLFVLFFAIDVVMLYALEGEVAFVLIWQLFLYMLSAILLMLIIVFFARLVSIMNAMIYGVILFMIGAGSDELYYFATNKESSELLSAIAHVIYYLFPNFSFFDFQTLVVNRAHIELFEFLAHPLLYFLGYSFILLAAIFYLFEKEALKVGQ